MSLPTAAFPTLTAHPAGWPSYVVTTSTGIVCGHQQRTLLHFHAMDDAHALTEAERVRAERDAQCASASVVLEVHRKVQAE